MRRKGIYVIQIALALVLIIGLVAGCEMLSPTSTPDITPEPTLAPSEYPADISGQVTIAEKVKCLSLTAVPPNEEGDIFWIVDITVKNNVYTDPVEADFQMRYKGWVITANDKAYMPAGCGSSEENPPIDLTVGQTGQFMLHFIVPQTLQINDSQICYQGQEPYSYGKLTGGDKVAAYDWDSKTVIEETKEYDQYTQYFVKKEITGYKKVGEMGNIDITEPIYEDIYMKLKTIGHWERENEKPKLITFHVSQAPWVVNWGYQSRKLTALDPIGSEATFDIAVYTKADYERYLQGQTLGLALLSTGEDRGISSSGIGCIIVQNAGDYIIKMSAKNPNNLLYWWIKIGVE